MGRKGISFTMTLAVVGVLLVVTAVVMVGLGGTGITKFFENIGGTQDKKATQHEIRQACAELKEDIDDQYCDMYMEATYEGQTSADDDIETGPDCGDCNDDGSDENEPCGNWQFCKASHYQQSEWEVSCRDSDFRMQDSRLVPSLRLANASFSPDDAYPQTASELNCDWSDVERQILGPNPYQVTVNGDTYNCRDEGFITSTTCPAE